MKNKKVIISVVIFIIGLGCGFILGINTGLNIQRIESKNTIQNTNNKTQSNRNNTEIPEEVSLKQKMSEDEITKLKTTIEKDESR